MQRRSRKSRSEPVATTEAFVKFGASTAAVLVSIGVDFGSLMAVVATSTSPIQLPANGTYLFGQLSFSTGGNLFFVDMQHSQLDEVTNSSLKVIVSMPKVKTSPNVGEGIRGLSIQGNTLWFSANGSLYRASLDGRNVEHVASVSGVLGVDALSDGDVLYGVVSGEDARVSTSDWIWNNETDGGGK